MLTKGAPSAADASDASGRRPQTGDIHALGDPSGSYDAIVMPFVLTLLAAPEQALDNCRRMLRPGGEIIIVSHFQSRHLVIAQLERWLAPRVAGLGLRAGFPDRADRRLGPEPSRPHGPDRDLGRSARCLQARACAQAAGWRVIVIHCCTTSLAACGDKEFRMLEIKGVSRRFGPRRLSTTSILRSLPGALSA